MGSGSAPELLRLLLDFLGRGPHNDSVGHDMRKELAERRSTGFLGLGLWWMLLLLGCTRPVPKPEITVERIRQDLTDKSTGKIQAADLGLATLSDVRLTRTSARGGDSWPVVEVKAEQQLLGETHALTARLELHYTWAGRNWQLRETREVRKWADLTARAEQPGLAPGAADTDSSALQQLLRARRAAQRNLGGIPVIPW